MIPWWVVLGVWLVLVGVAALRDGEVLNALNIVVFAALPLLPIVWLLTRLDVGAVPLEPRALERFARMRTADKRPAFCFFAWKRGVILLRRWDVGSDKVKVELDRSWK